MKIVKIFVLGFVMTMAYLSSVPAVHAQQLWNSATVEGALTPSLKLAIDKEVRTDFRGRGFYYDHTEFGLTYRFKNFLGLKNVVSFGAGYRQVFEKDKKEGWLSENRPTIHVTLGLKSGKWELVNRNRLEGRFREKKDDALRLRHRLVVKTPVEFKWLLKSRVVVSDEIFIDPLAGEFQRNRFTFGTEQKIYGPVGSEVFFMRQDTIGTDPINALGVKLKINF